MKARTILAAALKRLRARSGLSQAELAERASLSTQHIAALEQGRKEPSLGTLDALSRALSVSHAELFVPDDRTPRLGFVAEVAELLAGLSQAQRERVLVIMREASALARRAR